MSKARKVQFAKLKLQGPAKVHWTSVERRLEREGQEPIMTWVEMKAELKKITFLLPLGTAFLTSCLT